jgi:hypothetical protein
MWHSLRWVVLYLLLGAVWQIGTVLYGRARLGRRAFEVAMGSVTGGRIIYALVWGVVIWPIGALIALIPTQVLHQFKFLRRAKDEMVEALNEDGRRFCPDCGEPLLGKHKEHNA